MQWRQWWPIVKLILALAVLGAVGWRFAVDLRQLREQTVSCRWEWLAAGGLVYLLGLTWWGGFWHWLLRSVGERPPLAATARTYFIGHLGKYVPGKAWGLLLRTGLLYEAGVRPAVGALTATYETLTTMAAGTLLAVALFAGLRIDLPEDLPWEWTIAALLALVVVPILPGVFNPMMRVVGLLAARAARRFKVNEMAPLPRVAHSTFLVGLVLTGAGWGFLGLSLWCVVRALAPEGPPLEPALWGRYTAYVALAYVAGFVMIFLPAGLGARELLLQAALTPELGAAVAVVVVLVLRLLWTLAEVMMAGILYWLPVPRGGSEAEPPVSETATTLPTAESQLSR
jgi:uncharacterized membrane protein YbhN (UPF0104 family)